VWPALRADFVDVPRLGESLPAPAHRGIMRRIVGETLPPPRLLDRVHKAFRVRHYSLRTEEAYVAWIRRFILFHNKPVVLTRD
jgi:hypothetical protein